MTRMLGYAVRHLRRRARESALLAGIFLVAALVCLAQLAQRRGVEERARRLLVDALSGTYVLDAAAAGEPVDVLAPQADALPPFAVAAAERRAARAGLDATPRLRLGALVGHGDKSLGLVLHAIAPAHLARVARALELAPDGHVPNDDVETRHGALLSDVIAEYLDCRVGDTLAVLATNRAGYVSDGVLVVRGIFSTRGAGAFLTGTAFVPHEDGAALLGLAPGETTELVARPRAGASTLGPALAAQLAHGAPLLRATPWERSAPLVDAVLRVWRAGGAITQTVFSCTAFLLLLNAILSKLHDRTRELGTLRALGMRTTDVVAAVALEYVLLAWGACALAAALLAAAVAATRGHGIPLPSEALQVAYMGRRLYPALRVADLAWVTSLFTGVALLATLAPIARAVRRQPAALLRTRT